MIKLPKVQSQQDSRWGSVLLGNNTEAIYNLANYGCLITCFSMACCYYGFDTNPLELNERLKENGGFTKGGGNYVWTAIQKVTDKLKDVLIRVGDINPVSDSQIGQIKDALDIGMPVILHIDYNPRTVKDDQHWVLALGYNPDDENDYTIADPIDGQIKSLKKYLGWFRPSMKRTTIDYVVLVGKAPETSNLKEISIDFDDGEGKRHTVGWYVYEWLNEKIRAIKLEEKYSGLGDSLESYKKATGEVLIAKNKEIEDAINKYNKDTKVMQKEIVDRGIVIENQKIQIIQLVRDKNYSLEIVIKLLVDTFQKWLEGIFKGGVNDETK